MGDLIQRMVRYFAVVRRQLRRHRRAVVTAAAVVVFATTYALMLPAITLDEGTANDEPGLELGATSEETSNATAEVPTADESEQPAATEEQTAVSDEQAAETPEATTTEETSTDTVVDTPAEAQYLTDGTTLTFDPDGEDYTVTAKVNADAQLPAGTTVTATEIKSDDERWQLYHDATLAKLQEQDGEVDALDNLRLFDISFVDANGAPVEPAAEVKVSVAYDNAVQVDDASDVKVVHFDDDTAEASVLADDKTAVDAPDNQMGKVEFTSDQFSVYAITETTTVPSGETKEYRRTYTFQNDNGNAYKFTLNDNPADSGNETQTGTVTNQQIVKNGGQLLDVGTPTSTMDSTKQFLGWGVVTGEGESATVDTSNLITLPATVSGLTGDDSVTLRAVYSNDIKITFYDVDNTTILNTVKATPNSTLDLSQYEATPSRSEQGFLGWATTQNATTALGSNYTVPNTDTNLYPVVATGHWLRFDKNDSDDDPTEATYTSPVFVTGEVSSDDKPTDPTRTGYTFAGWYEKDDDGNLSDTQYSFSGTLTDSKTLYAKWTPNTVNYRVVYWEENPDDYGFSYYRSGTLTGTAGQNTNIGSINLTDADGNTVQGFHHHSSTETDRTDEAHLAHATQDVVIRGDGTTVVNVYFDRDIYTVKFVNSSNATSGTWVEVTSQNDVHGSYNYYNGDEGYAFYQADNGSYTEQQVKNYLSSYYVYNRNTSGSTDGTIDELTITAKYGASIANQWPSRRTGLSQTYPAMWRVNETYNSRGTNTYQTNISTMPLGGATFYYQAQSGTEFKTHYYIQSVNGGDSFTLDHTDVTQYSGSLRTSAEDYYDMRGFTPVFNTASDATNNGDTVANYVTITNSKSTGTGVETGSTEVSSTHTSASNGTQYSHTQNGHQVVDNEELNFYYARNQYEIDFTPNDGLGTVDITSSYYYEASIANAAPRSYVKGQTTVSASNGDTLTFQGWYDNPDGLGDEYDFSGKTMPANNIHLYGKWAPTTYTFTANPNSGSFADGTTENKVTEQVAFGTVISEDDYRTPTREGYEFVGWYVQNADGTESVYNFSTPVTGNVTIIAHWKKTGSYGVHYVIQDSNTDPAKSDGDAVTKNDDKTYADQSDVTVLSAPETDQIPAGYEFVGWFYNGKNYKPGDTFTLDASNATTGDNKITVGEKSVNYVTLTAIYTKIDTTYLTYNANSGTGALKDMKDASGNIVANTADPATNTVANIPYNSAIELSKGAGFTRDGYVLVGWNSNQTAATAGTIEWNLGEKVGVNGEEGNTLYAVWRRAISIKKVDNGTGDDQKTLANATFKLMKTVNGADTNVGADDFYGSVTVPDGGYTVTTGNEGTVSLGVLKAGSYKLTETQSPDGYNKTASDIAFTVDDSGSVTFTDTTDVTYNATTLTFTVKNTPGEALPNTGGAGTAPFAAAGAALITLATLGFAARRRTERRDAR